MRPANQVVEAVATLRPALAGAAATFVDRIVVFNRLANGHSGGADPGSTGVYIAVLCGAVYLAEKYFLPDAGRNNLHQACAARSAPPNAWT